jgi:signal transduction histidine kinase
VGWWAITVADSGIGIPPEAHTLIYEPFGQVDGSMTRRQKGTGLGLSIVKQLVQLMGGSIDLASAPDQGSEFTITLPLNPASEHSIELQNDRPKTIGLDSGRRRIHRNGRS